MSNYSSREELRQVYQREDQGEKTFIPAKPKADLYGGSHTFRTCAYCRVSTDNDEQLSSFELQQNHYKHLVQDHPNWEAELEKTSQIRQEFTANASHELKTPLHAISGYAELLENGMVKQSDIRPFAGKIRLEAQRMTQLVGDIIDLTRLDGGADGMQWEKSDLKRIAENAADSLQSAAAENGIELTVTGEEALISGIPQVLYSIVYNLCDNAIKYNHPGGKVRVAVANEPDAVCLTVSDTGIGISEEHQSRIFERFYRVDKSRSKEVGGTGLGLSIVKHGLIIHKAKLELDSTLDKGTTFIIHFPK